MLVVLAAAIALPAWAQTPAPTTRTPPPRTAAVAHTPAPAQAPNSGKVDINAATEAQLDALPGIGPVRAKAIVAGRPYMELGDLVKKKILTQAVFDKAKSGMALANINTSSAGELARTLPGVGATRSKEIVAGRPYAAMQDLVTKKVLTQALFDKIKDLIAY